MNTESKKKAPGIKEIVKPFIRGDAFDENTVKGCLKFFGTMVVIILVSFIACSATAFGSTVLRLALNLAVIAVEMMLYFNFEGFINALIGTLPILIPALILAFRTTVLTTEAGTLPSWMQAYAGRSEIGDALINYTQPEAMDAVDYIRAFIRICIMPFVNVIGHDSKNGMFLLERISPLIVMLPSVFYGFGYMSGRKIRTRIHTVISENDKNRIRKERKRIRKQNTQARRREPEQLN